MPRRCDPRNRERPHIEHRGQRGDVVVHGWDFDGLAGFEKHPVEIGPLQKVGVGTVQVERRFVTVLEQCHGADVIIVCMGVKDGVNPPVMLVHEVSNFLPLAARVHNEGVTLAVRDDVAVLTPLAVDELGNLEAHFHTSGANKSAHYGRLDGYHAVETKRWCDSQFGCGFARTFPTYAASVPTVRNGCSWSAMLSSSTSTTDFPNSF